MKNDIELYKSFFQKRDDYYLEKLDKYYQGKKFTFNYATLIFGIFWFLYRKMYIEAIIIYSLISLESLFENLFLKRLIGEERTVIFSLCVTVLFIITTGFSGNLLYLKKAMRIVSKAKKKYPDFENQNSYVAKKGGTSFIVISIVIISLVLILALQ